RYCFLLTILAFFRSHSDAQHFGTLHHVDTTVQLLDTSRQARWGIRFRADLPLHSSRTSQEPKPEENFLRSGFDWLIYNIVPATFNRFITKDPYSYISLINFINHLRLSAWDWDDNQFTTNHLDHPYHGQLYFNAFRS